jgi:Ran GTPase-activating protein (RanGAP) involved in mRNA processing and transport
MSDNEEFIDEDPERFVLYMGLIRQLRTNDPSALPAGGRHRHFSIPTDFSDNRRVDVVEALRQNTIIQRIMLLLEDYKAESAEAMAKYLAQSKSLLSVNLSRRDRSYFRFFGEAMDIMQVSVLATFMEALSQSTSLQDLGLMSMEIGPASKSFENLLTRTQTLRYLKVDLDGGPPLAEVETAAIASGFSKNTTLQKIDFIRWREESLTPVLTALQDHPVLEILHVKGVQSLTGIDDLLRSKKSRVKEVTIQGCHGYPWELVGFESFMQGMRRNTTVLKMAINGLPLSRDNVQQLKAMLRHNTVLEDLNLAGAALLSTGLAELTSALYRNTNIQGLDLSHIILDEVSVANALRELLRRNKTITRLSVAMSDFGRSVAVVRCITDGLRSNTTLQVLDLSFCRLDDECLGILAQSLGHQKRSLVNLNLSNNYITPNGIGALIDNATAALSGVTHLGLHGNPVVDEGASLLADSLRLQTLPSLKCLRLDACAIEDDGFATLVSALEQNESLEIVSLEDNYFCTPGLLALAASLPNIKGLREINLPWRAGDDLSVMPELLEGFRKNTSLHEVSIEGCEPGEWSKDLSFILYRNKFSRLIRDSDTDNHRSLGLWSHALASVTTRPDVLFHVLTSKPGLVRAKPGKEAKKRKRDDSE